MSLTADARLCPSPSLMKWTFLEGSFSVCLGSRCSASLACSLAGPAKPLLMLFLMTRNRHSFSLPFPSHPPSSTALSSWKPAFIDHIWPQLFILHVGPSQHFPVLTHMGLGFSYLRLVPTAGFIAPKVHGSYSVSGTRVAIQFIPGESRERLSNFPCASFPPGLECPEVSVACVDPALLGARGGWREARRSLQPHRRGLRDQHDSLWAWRDERFTSEWGAWFAVAPMSPCGPCD